MIGRLCTMHARYWSDYFLVTSMKTIGKQSKNLDLLAEVESSGSESKSPPQYLSKSILFQLPGFAN